MTFTYTNDPANSNRDAVRVLVNDITETTNSLSDETITWLLANHSSVWYAAAAAAEVFVATFVNAVSEKQVGDLRIKAGGGDPAAQYTSLAELLRTQANVKGFTAYSGGISISDKDSELADSDRPADQAWVGQHDNLDTAGNSTSGRWDF